MALITLTLDIIRGRCEEVGECWMWQQGTANGHAPIARHNGKAVGVRRLVVELSTGKKVRRGWFVVARCWESKCCNPAHLHAVHSKEYMRLLNEHGFVNNTRHTAAKTASRRARSALSMEQAQELRRRHMEGGELLKDLAVEFGISKAHASRIKRHVNWAGAVRGASVFSLPAA